MADREPTVIERMFNAFDADYCERFGIVHDRGKGHQAMLAAVRVLRDILDHEGSSEVLLPLTSASQAYDASNVIDRIILHHEPRSSGKG